LVGFGLVWAVVLLSCFVRGVCGTNDVYKTNAFRSLGAVGEFVRDDSCQFGFVLYAGEEAGRDLDAVAGKGGCADIGIVYKTNFGAPGHLMADAAEVVFGRPILK
jgi:hypothetical protein